MIKNITVCNNCGKQGHLFHQCKLPITSYGIVVFRNSIDGLQFLMIRRKNSYGFIDFIRGKYSPYNIEQLKSIIDEMSIIEKQKLLEMSFENLWVEMWGETNFSNNQFKNEENVSKKKFELLKEGIIISDTNISLKSLVIDSITKWNETEWEFPKGRRNQKEKDIDCALREFEEETGIDKNKLTIIENLMPFEETFIGSNHKSYKHKYFLAYIDDEDEQLHNFQKTEVSKLEWMTFHKCLESIRPYNLEKKELITNINKVLQEYRLYS
jgi:8-oxo-dGTP pyrophosphatase MutT (NUDIX family)